MPKGDVEDRVTILETQGKNDKATLERIEGNTTSIMLILSKLPCQVHKERIAWLRASVYVIWGVLIITGIIKGAFFMQGAA